MAVFHGWGRYLSYGVPACLMICMEWWTYELLILLAGALLECVYMSYRTRTV
jgi:MATE family multidrug resistance protein